MKCLALPLAAGIVFAGLAAPAAKAETNSCWWTGDPAHYCWVEQTTAAGDVIGLNDYYPKYQESSVYVDNQNSGFSVIGWADQRYAGGPATTVWGPTVIANGDDQGVHVPDAGAYQVRTCFKFTWASAAVHCTDWY